MANTRPQTEPERNSGSNSAGSERPEDAKEGFPPEPDDAADKAQDASLDPDDQRDVGGDQDIDTAGTDADQEVSLKERERMTQRQK